MILRHRYVKNIKRSAFLPELICVTILQARKHVISNIVIYAYELFNIV